MSNGKQNSQVLSAAELEALQSWVLLADQLGASRSIGQLYGLLFLSEHALSAQDCSDRLQISRSSAGQGLRILKELGAIKSTFALGDRSERFVIEPDLGILLKGLIGGRIIPALNHFFQTMSELESSGKQRGLYAERLLKLKRWQGKLFPAIQKMNDLVS